MLKKAGAVAAIAAGLMLVGSPAFAGEPDHHDWGHDHSSGDTHQWNSGSPVSLLNNNNLNVPVGLCGANVPILAVSIPIASQNTGNCAVAGTYDGDDGNVGGNSAG